MRSGVTDIVIRGRRVLTPEGLRAASIHVHRGRIARVAAWDDVPTDVEVVDAGNNIVMPGVIDTHVHVNEPGRTEWEGFDCATHAAAAGGVTTILDMPLNSIPATTTVAALEVKRRAARGKTVVNVEYIGGVIPGNSRELEGLRDAGVRAVDRLTEQAKELSTPIRAVLRAWSKLTEDAKQELFDALIAAELILEEKAPKKKTARKKKAPAKKK